MERQFKTYGFDYFVGRCIEENGEKALTYLDLKYNGKINICLDFTEGSQVILSLLCGGVQDNKKILMAKSPGYLPPREVNMGPILDVSREFLIGSDIYPRIQWQQAPPTTFETLSLEELSRLENMYNKRLDMKLYPNPFLYQPS